MKDLDSTFVQATLQRIRNMVADSFDQMKTSAEDVPLVAVGGGAFLIPETVPGASDVLRVENAGVANALGAAMAQVSGEVDQVFSGLSRDEALAKAETEAQNAAVASGAERTSLKTLEVEDIPIAYLPGGRGGFACGSSAISPFIDCKRPCQSWATKELSNDEDRTGHSRWLRRDAGRQHDGGGMGRGP